MKSRSRKNKGKRLQNLVKTEILSRFLEFTEDDIISAPAGVPGEDLIFSSELRKILPISIECKSRNKFSIYKYFEQAKSNCKENNPVLIIKQDRSEPLAIIDFNFFMDLVERYTLWRN